MSGTQPPSERTERGARFAKGPWRIEADDNFADTDIIPITALWEGKVHFLNVCDVCANGPAIEGYPLTEIDRANARLIAAAPDLYDLLADFIDTAGNPSPELLTRAAALLAQIDGEAGQ